MDKSDPEHLRLMMINIVKALREANKEILLLQSHVTAWRNVMADLREPPFDRFFGWYHEQVEIVITAQRKLRAGSIDELLSQTLEQLERD